jgi:hypothetical protein
VIAPPGRAGSPARVKDASGAWVTGTWQSWKSVGATTHSAAFTGSAGVTYGIQWKRPSRRSR